MAARGIKVLKLHPHTQKFDVNDPRVLALVRRAGELRVIVLMDNANILPGDSENLFNGVKAPKTKLSSVSWPSRAPPQNFFGDNIYFDISATVTLAASSPIQNEFVWTMHNVGMDHLLLGSDFPQLSLPQTLAAFNKLGLTEEEKAKIASGTRSFCLG